MTDAPSNPAVGPPVGRFAPSPSGPLHFGSLVAALASWLSVRSRGGRWHLRIDDLDGPRTVPGAADHIRATLEALELTWDGPVGQQANQSDRYEAACAQLVRAGHGFACGCFRREFRGRPYPGTCRHGLPTGRGPRSLRLAVPDAPVTFEDLVQGPQAFDLSALEGDFIIRRSDGLYGYHLACVLDDAALGVTEVVRGADLLGSTANQRLLAERLGLAMPTPAHVPLATTAKGDKLSKHCHAPALPPKELPRWLHAALAFLGQPPPADLAAAPCAEQLAWAQAHWSLASVPPVLEQHAPAFVCEPS